MAGSSVLAVFAHPDDAELACFGTLAALSAGGREIHILALTNGENSRTEQAYLRPKEARESASLIGAQLTVENFDDGALELRHNVYAKVEDYLKRLQPSIVITHFPGPREHQDHQVTGTIVVALALQTKNVDLILQGEPPIMVDTFCPNLYSDITDYIDVKLNAVACYRSEEAKRFMNRDTIMDRAKWWARQAEAHSAGNGRFYEAFVVAKAMMRSNVPAGL